MFHVKHSNQILRLAVSLALVTNPLYRIEQIMQYTKCTKLFVEIAQSVC